MKHIYLPGILLIFLLFVINSPAISQTPDPGIAGTHTVIKAEYNLGNSAFTVDSVMSIPMEVIGSVHYPSDLSSGPFPVIFIEHGRHSTCYDSVTHAEAGGWPCTGVNKPITSYEGYDYLGANMASHGYIVISISANAINAVDAGLADDGMAARGRILQHHMDLWNRWTTIGGFPGDSLLFKGKLNMQNIGTMGHSRGGEGAVFNAQYNDSLGHPYGIKAVLTLAPVDFYRHVLNRIPLMNVAPYCDGDVSDLQGVHFYDDARYNDTADESPKHNVLFMGANHDFFNTVWTPGSYIAGGFDDWLYGYSNTAAWCGPDAAATGRFDTTVQKAALKAYFAAFYRIYLGHENQFAPILDVDDHKPPVSSMLDSAQVHVSFHPARMNRLDLNRTDSINKLTINTLQDSVKTSLLYSIQVCSGGNGMIDCMVTDTNSSQLPHDGSFYTSGLGEMGMQWSDTNAYYENYIPAARQNLTAYQDILFRTSINFSETIPGPNLDFTIQLIDSAGNIAGQKVSKYSNALFNQPGNEYLDLPKLLFNTVKVPLDSFAGVNLAKVRKVKFLFNKSAAGSIFISDLAFSNAPCSGITANFKDTTSGSWKKIAFTNTTVANTTDSITWYWNFGDVASGIRDTSTLKMPPVHTYTLTGAHNVCLSVTAHRKNGFICTDTFCKAALINYPAAVAQVTEQTITIAPNPASDHLYITGAAATDVLVLTDLYGRVILSVTLANSTVRLPQNLAAGVYYATVNTATGKVYKKILIAK